MRLYSSWCTHDANFSRPQRLTSIALLRWCLSSFFHCEFTISLVINMHLVGRQLETVQISNFSSYFHPPVLTFIGQLFLQTIFTVNFAKWWFSISINPSTFELEFQYKKELSFSSMNSLFLYLFMLIKIIDSYSSPLLIYSPLVSFTFLLKLPQIRPLGAKLVGPCMLLTGTLHFFSTHCQKKYIT